MEAADRYLAQLLEARSALDVDSDQYWAAIEAMLEEIPTDDAVALAFGGAMSRLPRPRAAAWTSSAY